MEAEEIEAVLEKIWDLHDKLSDAIHSNSRSHFLIATAKSVPKKISPHINDSANAATPQKHGYVFTKEPLEVGCDAVSEARSLNAIRSALENLEDQLEFFHTIQTQQRAERDAAIARLEQSRIILAMRLTEHQGKKYKVIEEALAFVQDVEDASRFVFPEILHERSGYISFDNHLTRRQNEHNPVLKFFISSLGFLKKSISADHIGGLLGSTAVFTVSLFAFLHLQNVSCSRNTSELGFTSYDGCIAQKLARISRSSSNCRLNQLDVTLARG